MSALFKAIGFILLLPFKIIGMMFGGRKKKDPDRYYVVQERHTQVRNHVVKVPGKKK